MTFKKIRGIDKQVCTAEQKIAYNFACICRGLNNIPLYQLSINTLGFPCSETVRRTGQKIQREHPEFKTCKSVEEARMENEQVFRLAYMIADETKRSPELAKYDIDSIIHCFRNGFINYKNNYPTILTDYETIGKVFYSLYEIM